MLEKDTKTKRWEQQSAISEYTRYRHLPLSLALASNQVNHFLEVQWYA